MQLIYVGNLWPASFHTWILSQQGSNRSNHVQLRNLHLYITFLDICSPRKLLALLPQATEEFKGQCNDLRCCSSALHMISLVIVKLPQDGQYNNQ
jgi:hypothetical protein